MKNRVDVDVFGCDVEQHNRAELAPCPYCEIDRLRDKHEVEIEALKEAFADLSKRIYWLEVKNKSCR